MQTKKTFHDYCERQKNYKATMKKAHSLTQESYTLCIEQVSWLRFILGNAFSFTMWTI